jgi:peptidoglycan/xylan/chitin deacetylase (PgdA/CDA1 family)
MGTRVLYRAALVGVGLCVRGFDLAGGLARRALGMRRPGRCVALLYHLVGNTGRSKFAWQMGELSRRCRPIPVNHREALAEGCAYAMVTFDDGYAETMRNALPELRARGIPYSVFVPTAYIGREAVWASESKGPSARSRVMSADELREIGKDPLCVVGSHTESHRNLRGAEPELAQREMEGSRSTLSGLLEKDVTVLSLPYGEFTPDTIIQAEQAGYNRILTTDPLPAAEMGTTVIGRINVEPEDWRIEFRLKLFAAYRWFPGAMRIARRIKGRRSVS